MLAAPLALLPTFAALLCAAPAQDPAPAAKAPETIWQYLSTKYDENGDGRVTRAEYGPDATRFERMDKDGDGAITESDTRSFGRPQRMPDAGGEGDGAPLRRKDTAPEVHSVAPDFELPLLHSEKPKTVKLSSFRGEKPVALIFGSYT